MDKFQRSASTSLWPRLFYFQTRLNFCPLTSFTDSKSSPDLPIPTSSFPNKFFREGQTKNPTFSSPPVDILVILVRTERQRRPPSTENRFKIGLRNVLVENAVFSIDIEPRVILLVYWEASTTCWIGRLSLSFRASPESRERKSRRK